MNHSDVDATDLVAAGPHTVKTSMYFLQPQQLYATEKPYSLRFMPPEGFPRSNIALEKQEDVEIRDIRTKVDELSFSKHGFKIMPVHSTMTYDDYDDEEMIVGTYLREIADLLRDELGAKHCHIFEHTVGDVKCPLQKPPLIASRSVSDTIFFQSRPAKRTNTTSRHRWRILVGSYHDIDLRPLTCQLDTTVEWATDMVRKLNGAKAPDILQHRIQCVKYVHLTLMHRKCHLTYGLVYGSRSRDQ